MIPELGHAALILALGAALLQVFLPAWGVWRGDRRAVAAAGSTSLAGFLLVLLSYLCLTWAFIQKDFSVVYVAGHSHSELPVMYRISAVWGGHEGSLLLWLLMLSGWTLAVAAFHRRLPADVGATVLSVLGAVSIGFMLFTLLTSNPFDRHFPVPLEGRDLNPLLQDPGLVVHPPLLYMGYVGFSVAFAFAIAALITGRLDTAWARWTRPWTTAAWASLTLGIMLGSWWAYRELGWGGWWFWDPVENASFMPWLVGTALIHSLAVTEKRGLLKSWTVLLAIMAFSLSLLGTFLVRSGVLVSVHAFATDPARGVFILGFMTAVVGSSLTLYAWRAHKLTTDAPMTLFSREGMLLLNNVFLTVAAAAVLIGTLYPLFVDALGLGKISVGPPWFNAVFVPLTAPLIVLVGFATAVPWKRAGLRDVMLRLRVPLAIAAALALALPLTTHQGYLLGAVAGGFLGLWAMVAAVHDIWRRARRFSGLPRVPRAAWGMGLAHFGVGMFVLGVTYTSFYSVERDVRVRPGDIATLADYDFRFEGVQHRSGPNFEADRARVTVLRQGREVVTLHPEKREYRVSDNIMTQAAVQHRPHRDLYTSLGEPLAGGSEWTLRVYVKPMMLLVWLGGLIMSIGGIVALLDRRYRLATSAVASRQNLVARPLEQT